MSFGNGGCGQLGHGDEEQQLTPKLIEAAAHGVVEVAAGYSGGVLLGHAGEVWHSLGVAGPEPVQNN